MLHSSLSFVAAFTLLTSAYAADSSTALTKAATTESRTSINDSSKNEKLEDNAEITDAKLKADSGSLSKYSLKFNLSYSGAPIGDLNNPMQPNPDGSIGVFETSLSGSVSGRYRIDKKSTIGGGTGVSALTPLQGVKRYDVKNPFISYDLSTKINDVQIRNALTLSAVTNIVYRNVGEYAGIGYDNSLVYNLGVTPVALALDTSLNYYLFERGYVTKDKNTERYKISFFPAVKYNFSDRFNLNTSLAIAFANPRYTEDNTVLLNKVISQRLAVGYGYSHDIYFSPYLNFYPGQLALDSTTINFTTTFSVL